VETQRDNSPSRNKVSTSLQRRTRRLIRCQQDRVRVCLYAVAPAIGMFVSVRVGRHAGFDFLNRRWFMGWLILRDIEDMPGALQRLAFAPYVNDVATTSVAVAGIWWLGPAILGALHGLICPLVYDIIRSVAPDFGKGLSALAASLSLSSPLVFVHLGRETGHILAAVLLVAAVHHLAVFNSRANVLWLACLLVLALLIKLSSIFTVGVVLLVVAFSLPWRKGLQLLLHFALIAGIAVALLSIVLWRSGGERYISLGDLVRRPNYFLFWLTIILVSNLVFYVFGLRKRPRSHSGAVSYLQSCGLLLVVVACLIVVARFPFLSDPAFRPDSWTVALRRAFSTGQFASDVSLGSGSLRDLEYDYYDVGKRLSLGVLVVAVVSLFGARRADAGQRIGRQIALAPGAALAMSMLAYGYVRYAVEALVMVPLGLAVLLGTFGVRTAAKQLALGLGLCIYLLPAIGLGDWRGYDVQTSRPGIGAIVDTKEREVLSALIPSDAPVFFFGRLVTWVAPVVDRSDPTWFVKPLGPEEVGNSQAILFYELETASELDKFTTRGWILSDCQALRFENAALGWCALSAD